MTDPARDATPVQVKAGDSADGDEVLHRTPAWRSTRTSIPIRTPGRSGRRSIRSCSTWCSSTRRRSSSSTTGAEPSGWAKRLNELNAERIEKAAIDAAEATGEEPVPPSAAEVAEIARAHHGSLAHEERTVIEEMLKSGRLPCLVATVLARARHRHGRRRPRDPGRVAEVGTRGLQRIGRAGHGPRRGLQGPHLPQVPGRPFSTCAVRRQAHARGQDRGDGDPAQSARRARPAHRLDRRRRGVGEVDELERVVKATEPFSELGREQLENVLDMLDGRYPSEKFAELRPRVALGSLGRHRPRSQGLAPARRDQRGARSPTAASTASTCPTASGSASSTRRWSTRPGPARPSCLGATTWRIEEITRDRVIVTRLRACPEPSPSGAVTASVAPPSWAAR